MTIKEFKEKLTQIDYKTGARKATAIVTIVAALAVAPTMAYASVPAENIIGDAQVTEDRSAIKIQDAKDIRKEFYGFNKHGVQTITMDDVRKAIELSDILNGYYFDPVAYTNTTKDEVLDLDVDKLYEEYIIARYNEVDRTDEFCANHLEDKPAIDAYVTFVCGTVSNNIQASVADSVNAVITTEGFEMTANPKVIIENNTLYVILEVEGQTQLVELTGEYAADIVNVCTALNYHYHTAINNLSGRSNEYENTFAYNGIDKETGESVWLSFPDDTKQTNLETGIAIYEQLDDSENFEITSENPMFRRELTEAEKNMLRYQGYDEYQIQNAVGRETYIGLVEKTMTK